MSKFFSAVSLLEKKKKKDKLFSVMLWTKFLNKQILRHKTKVFII